MTPESWPALRFLASDAAGIAAAFALFAPVAFVPGYALGWLTDALEFRSRTLPFRLAASVPLSLGVAPVLGYAIGRPFGLGAVWLAYAALAIAAAATGALRRKDLLRGWSGFRPLAPFAAAIAIWLAIAFLSLADLPLGRRLYFSIIDFDYSVRIAFTNSIGAFDLPARNPFFFPGHPVALRYHYFWMIVCAQVFRIGSPLVDAREAFIAGTMWMGIGMISLVPLGLRICGSVPARLARRSLTGIALLAVTGLDIVPSLLMAWLSRLGLVAGISPSVEWWNEQVDGFLYTMLWEPHYVCSLAACLTGCLILWSLPPEGPLRRRAASAAIAGAAFASAAGSGVYVAMVFALFLAAWLALAAFSGRRREAATLAGAGAFAAALILPFLAGLANSAAAGGPAPVEFTVRAFAPAEIALRLFGLDRPWQRYAAALVALPLNYFMELGVFFIAGLIAWTRFRNRKRPATRFELAAILLAGASIGICTFLKSSLIANNDLGWRGFLPAQFVLLLCAASVLPEALARRPVARWLLVLGAAGVLYDLAILRFYPPLSDAGLVPYIGWLANDRNLGLRTAANREAYEWLRARTPRTAVIQQNPEPVYQDTFFGAYGHRQTAASGACGMGFGGDPAECAQVLPVLANLFAGGDRQALDAACRSLPLDVVVAKDTDAAWRDRSGWVWTGSPVFANDFVRLFRCR